jgi:putative transposase
VVGPRAEREAVRVARKEGKLSERRACELIGMNRGSWRYQRKERNEAALRARLREMAGERPRFGYRRLQRMLCREKWVVNHKRVYRLYREEGLSMRRRKSKRFRAEARVPLLPPAWANQMWTMDFTRDSLANGRKFRTLNLMDGFTREALCIEVDTSLPGMRVVQVLERVAQERGLPEAIQVDNGPEFISRVVDHNMERSAMPPITRFVHSCVRSRVAWPVGLCQRRGTTLYRSRQTSAECVHRKLQRKVSR